MLKLTFLFLTLLVFPSHNSTAETRTYQNKLTLLENPAPLLADHPQFFEPIIETTRYEAPILVQDEGADLSVRAWRFSYNARGIIEMPNELRASETAVIVVHPWGIDDGQGWKTPEPAGVCDFCTPFKNDLSHDHIREVLNPFLLRMRGKVGFIMHSLPGEKDPIRAKVYRALDLKHPSPEQLKEGRKELHEKLNGFDYTGDPLPSQLEVSQDLPVIDYFKQFPGLDASAKYNGEGYWDLPIPVIDSIDLGPHDVVIYDAEGYEPLRDLLKEHKIRHVLLTGYATDMCYKLTTAGYENLSKDFNVFLVGDASLATFPANSTPRFATNAAISFASLNQLITQVSWVQFLSEEKSE
jgi:hypothetical protein